MKYATCLIFIHLITTNESALHYGRMARDCDLETFEQRIKAEVLVSANGALAKDLVMYSLNEVDWDILQEELSRKVKEGRLGFE